MTRPQLDHEAAWMRYRYGRGPLPQPVDGPTPGYGRHMATVVRRHEVAEVQEWEMWA